MARNKDVHTVNDAYAFNFRINALTGGGFFRSLYSWAYSQQIAIAWLDGTGAAKTLDIDYHGLHSGRKRCSPLVEDLLTTFDDDVLPYDPCQQAIAAMVWKRFGENWTARYNALITEYAPLENYSMTEVMADDITEHEKGATNTRTYDTQHGKTGTDTTTPNTEITAEGSVYGYDSSTPTPDNKTVTSTSGTNETEYNTEETDTGTITDVGSGTDTDTRNYTLTRSGNIGVTTSQQMLQSELEIRKYDFLISVYEDVDKILTIPIY